MAYDRITLNNGLRIIGERMEAVHTVAVGVFVRTGAVNEAPAENGYSHFVEHMVFKGTKDRDAAAPDSVRGCVHGLRLPLSLLEFIHEAHPLGFPGVQITGSAQGSGDIISADDILRQVGGHGIAHLTRQVEHGGLFFVCEEEDLRDLLQFLHFRRVAATLLNVTEVGCGYMEHFGHFSERYLLFLPFPL